MICESNVTASGGYILNLWNKDRTLAWSRFCKNGITNAGLNYLGGVAFSNTTQIIAWYAGLISSSGFSSLSVLDTMASHAGWNEFTGYSGTRPQWTNTTAGQQTSSNGSFSFPITANGTISGIFIVGGPGSTAVGGSNGTLWSTAQLPVNSAVSIGQILTGQYTVQYAGG